MGDKGLDRHACSTRTADRETGNTAEGLVDCGNAREFKRSSSVKLTRGNEGGNVLFTLSLYKQAKKERLQGFKLLWGSHFSYRGFCLQQTVCVRDTPPSRPTSLVTSPRVY